ncbi:MAG: helix-turn-helix domain-containing protein [Candidatus Enterenecus sp.]
MEFHEVLEQYIVDLGCTAKDLSEASGLSAATLSRYRSGERVPEPGSGAFHRLCGAIARLAEEKAPEGGAPVTGESVAERFLACGDIIAADREQFRRRLNTLISVLNLSVTGLCRHTNYDASALFRIRTGARRPSEPVKFAAAVAGYVSGERNSPADRETLAQLLGCPAGELADPARCLEQVRDWLVEGRDRPEDDVADFLEKLDEFDLNEYIKAIRFDELKVPSIPFQLPTSRAYFGLEEMMESELDFLKATVLSRSMAPVIMYSDMPMGEMSKDPEFPKKWMFGMAVMLKKGLHLNMIHNIDRPFDEMMLGLESWIPMYMTGQVSPYYLSDVQNHVFLHFLKVSGTAALSGEAIAGHHSQGKYYLTKNREEVAYYRRRAEALLDCAHPLMNIYRKSNGEELNAFLSADARTPGARRSVLSSLPLYTMEEGYLERFLRSRGLPDEDREGILAFAARERRWAEDVLEAGSMEDEVPSLTREEFERYPMTLSLSGMFREGDLPYTYEEYLDHLEQSRRYAARHPNYSLVQTPAQAFRNLQIIMHRGKWAMVSKGNAPAIHFVIHHPKLRQAIENFVPPVTEEP